MVLESNFGVIIAVNPFLPNEFLTETISFLSPKIWSLIPQNIKDSGSLSCLKKKKKTENGNPTAHVVYAKHICNMLVLFSSTAVLPSQFFSFFGFI